MCYNCGMITCKLCGEAKPIEDFVVVRGIAQKRCRDCVNTLKRQRYKANPDKAKASASEYKRQNIGEFDLWFQNKVCDTCGGTKHLRLWKDGTLDVWVKRGRYATTSLNVNECYVRCLGCERSKLDVMKIDGMVWTTTRDGYVITHTGVPSGSTPIYQHRYVMEKFLGRKLFGTENVHHINGDRKDNRIENLELWNVSQPAGQRVEDKITWAKEILGQYGYRVA